MVYNREVRKALEIGKAVGKITTLGESRVFHVLARTAGVKMMDITYSRVPFYSTLRHYAYYLLCTRFSLSESEIARRIGVSHSSVRYGRIKMESILASSEEASSEVNGESLETILGRNGLFGLLIQDPDYLDLDLDDIPQLATNRLELDGCFLRSSRQLSLMSRQDRNSVKAVIIYQVAKSIGGITVENLLSRLAGLSGISAKRMLGKERNDYLVPIRIAAARFYRDFGLSYPRIGAMLGGRDHSTIISSLDCFEYARTGYAHVIEKALGIIG